MSHIRPDEKAQRHRKSDCRKGRHDYGEAQNIGAGIVRRVCEPCGAVSIDLTHADELTTPIRRSAASILSMAARQSEDS